VSQDGGVARRRGAKGVRVVAVAEVVEGRREGEGRERGRWVAIFTRYYWDRRWCGSPRRCLGTLTGPGSGTTAWSRRGQGTRLLAANNRKYGPLVNQQRSPFPGFTCTRHPPDLSRCTFFISRRRARVTAAYKCRFSRAPSWAFCAISSGRSTFQATQKQVLRPRWHPNFPLAPMPHKETRLT
jgi:hypothetical protein